MSQQYPQQQQQYPQQQPFPPQHGNPPFNPNQPAPGPVVTPKKPRRWLAWVVPIVTFVLGIVIGSAGGGGSADTATSNPQPTVTKTVPGPAGATVPGPTVTQTVPGPAKTVTAPPPGPKASITDDGVYLVGTDIKPGTYRNGNEGDCYWARLRNTNGDVDSIIANGNGGNQVITIKSTDKAFETRYCGSWTKIK